MIQDSTECLIEGLIECLIEGDRRCRAHLNEEGWNSETEPETMFVRRVCFKRFFPCLRVALSDRI